ncbi:MAG: beta-lactamase family protein [Ignavibacteria bacterium]|nr:beta-lactamase family protein [Ignavibacteria bacterium]
MRFKILIILFIFILISCKTEIAKELPIDIAAQAQKRVDDGYHLGTIIGIVDKNGTYYYGFGQTSLQNKNKPDQNSIFEIGSITKTFTATLLADLNLKEEINIKSPVEDYLPVLKNIYTDSIQTITLETLSTHTSGLPREPLNMDPNDDNRYRDYTTKNLNEFLKDYKLDSISGEFRYSNLGVLIIEQAIENRINQSYEKLVAERIIDHLNMNDTYFKVPSENRSRIVKGFRDNKETEELDLGQYQSMGGLRSTAKDMLEYLKAEIGLKSTDLDEAIHETQKIHFQDDKNIMGLGWEILKREESGKTIYYHQGGTPGFVSFAGFNLKDQIGVVVLVNGRQWFSDLGFKILDSSYPLSEPEKD